jgi:hypothetical protein
MEIIDPLTVIFILANKTLFLIDFRILLENGADAFRENGKGYTARMIAESRKDDTMLAIFC